VQKFLDGLVSHYVFDDGHLVVAHAGMKQEMQGRGSAKVRDFALFGETTGETDDFGLPVRYNWASECRDHALRIRSETWPIPGAGGGRGLRGVFPSPDHRVRCMSR
jgi:protein phosphatase